MNKGKSSKTHQLGRNAKSGKFTAVKKARKNPKTHVVEHVPNPGRGDTKK